MRLILLCSLFILIQGCAQLFPTQIWEVSEGVFKIESSGNAFTSPASMRKKIDKKAVKACPHGFNYVGIPLSERHTQDVYVNGTWTKSSYYTLTRTAVCH